VGLQGRTSRIEPDIHVVHLSGNIVLGPDNNVASLLVQQLLRQGDSKIIVDLSEVDKVDSSGMQVLLECAAAAREAEATLRVAGASPRIMRLFRITQIDSVMPFYPTVAEACASFAATV
jgi:anti-sigma B factor antagonist